MKPRHLTEEDLLAMQARVRKAGPVGAGADSQGAGAHSKVSPVTSSPYKSKLEARYAAHLDMLVKAGEVKRWAYEQILLKLADDARYRPDFLVVLPGGMERRPELHEVKGKWIKNKRDSLTHLKWAAQKYGDVFTFRLMEWNGRGFDGKYVVTP